MAPRMPDMHASGFASVLPSSTERGDDRAEEAPMHVSFPTAMVVTALAASIVLVLDRGDRLFPVIALVAAGVEALIVFDMIQLSAGKLRIDILMPAALALAGCICWSKSSSKSTVTASTLVALVGIIQLLAAIRLFR
jgi:hypothetical protein